MTNKGKLWWAKVAVVAGAIPILIWAHDYGPDPGKNGVPGESNCTESNCHVGTALNGGLGSVAVTFPGGLTYVPGIKQHLAVTISDPAERKAGFQLTARQSGNTKAQAGTFKSTDGFTLVMCSDLTTLQIIQELDYPNSQTCGSREPLSYIEHNLAGASRPISTGIESYEFDWYPPSSGVGNVIIYVEGNGANGDGTERGDHIYSKTYTLAPASACPAGDSATTIAPGQISNGASYQPGMVPNAWLQIKGANLTKVTDTWANAVGADGALPTSLDCVSVSVGGQPAYIYFVSQGQINVLAPNVGYGSMPVTVTNSAGTSGPETASSQEYGPAFFTWPGNQVVATRTDYSLVVKNGTFAGATTVAAKPGDVVVLWGTGFGPTSPDTPVGVAIPPTGFVTASPVSVTIGGTAAAVYNNTAALAAGNAGLYQLAITVPATLADGDYSIVAAINGVSSPSTTILTVRH